jgi:hypothetical protein
VSDHIRAGSTANVFWSGTPDCRRVTDPSHEKHIIRASRAFTASSATTDKLRQRGLLEEPLKHCCDRPDQAGED